MELTQQLLPIILGCIGWAIIGYWLTGLWRKHLLVRAIRHDIRRKNAMLERIIIPRAEEIEGRVITSKEFQDRLILFPASLSVLLAAGYDKEIDLAGISYDSNYPVLFVGLRKKKPDGNQMGFLVDMHVCGAILVRTEQGDNTNTVIGVGKTGDKAVVLDTYRLKTNPKSVERNKDLFEEISQQEWRSLGK